MKSYVLFLALFIPLTGINVSGDEGWKHEFTRDSVEVYTREAAGYPVREFLGVTTIDAPLALIQKVADDADSYPEWMYECGKSKLIEKKDADNFTAWIVTTAPFPVSDRDVVIQVHALNRDNQRIATYHAVEHAGQPATKKYVRMPRLDGSWTFTALAENKTEVRYQVKSDPGGSVPDWIINLKVKHTPWGTLKNLRKQITKDKYK